MVSASPKKRKSKNEPIIESPYFSPSKKAKCSPTIINFNRGASPDTTSTRRSDRRTYPQLHSEISQRKPSLIQGDPWKLLVAVTLLNKTSGKVAIPVFWDIIARWPTPLTLSRADENELTNIIQRLGTQTVRAKRLILLSRTYLQDPPCLYDLRPSKPGAVTLRPTSPAKPLCGPKERYPPTPISHLPGTGPYALDSYRIFCTLHRDPSSSEWKSVTPSDKELVRFLKWKWAVAEHRQWSATSGPGGTATTEYLTSLLSELTS